MNLNREHFRAMIFYDFKLGLSQQECIDLLFCFWRSMTIVYDWFNEFKLDRVSLSDESREGRPITAITPESIDAVRKMIEEDRHTTYVEIEACLSITAPSIHTILHEHLHVRKLCARWIPHNLTKVQ